MTSKSSELPQLDFSYIHNQELLEIKKRREKNSYDPAEVDVPQPDLVGLALSGGGIRSATFCLGFLQELQRLRMLRIFDYLSTVSGGGYLGGWWSAWLSRRGEDTSKQPSFSAEDTRDVVSLLRRTADASDGVARHFREHLETSARGQKLLAVVRREDLPQLAPLLYEPVAEELNAYINKSGSRKQKWQRKTDLMGTFPCELRDIFPPPEQIEPEREENHDKSQKASEGSRCAWKDPIHHLRLFANYLTPRKGILSADTWRAISVIARNLILTWLILLPLLVGVMLLGQAYLFLNPATSWAFTCPDCDLTVLVMWIVGPIVVLLFSSVVMAIVWLLCNRDNSSPLDWITQGVCLVALVVLLSAGVLAIPPVRQVLADFFHVGQLWQHFFPPPGSALPQEDIARYLWRLGFVLGWFVILLGSVLLMWYWGLGNRRAFANGDRNSASLSSWKREVRRGRFSRAQSKLLVSASVVAAVLLLSWLSCLLTREGKISLPKSLRIPIALLPVLSAVGGSIFTAMRATPVPAADRSATKEPSWISRFIFAATPPLVVGVLAVAAAALVHLLLLSLASVTTESQAAINALLSIAAILAIGLCMGLSIYELEDIDWSKVLKASVPSLVFSGFIIVNVVWGAQAFFRYAQANSMGRWSYVLVTSIFFAVLITALVISRLASSRKWKLGSGMNGKDARVVRSVGVRLGSAAILFLALTTVGFVIGLLMYLNAAATDQNKLTTLNPIEKFAGKSFGALVLTTLALAGGMILFRVLVSRSRPRKGENQLQVRLPGFNKFRKRPEALWLAASLCLTLPLALIGVAHYLKFHGPDQLKVAWQETMIPFPLFVGLLLLTLMLLRALVIQKRLIEKRKPIVGWSGGIFEWLFDRLPKCENRQRAYQTTALMAICVVSLLDTVMQGFSAGEIKATLGLAPVNWKVMVVVLSVSLPVFGISVFQIPVEAVKYDKWKIRLPKFMYSKPILWFLATVCVGLAAVAGLLLPNWLVRVTRIPLDTGLTPILLPVAAFCFLIVLFEFYWGERDNLRSLLLVAFAYLAVTSIFFMQLAGDTPNWHLVLGLLAAICVWVAALGWMVDPNAVSMHQFYKGRLVRAYLGASNMHRFKLRNKEITETVAGDDLPLTSLINCERGGPYHVINTTLNLVAGRDLATAQRSASSFVLSQKYCGSARTNYCPTDKYMNGQLTLGTAVAASGAAVSPNMGAKKPTAALAMLMTLLNVRLGYWAPTPNHKGWNSSQPRLWPFYLVREFLSQTNDLSDYCYLTDGGHFDNTGLYSLIERGCRFVVLVDCGADPRPCFEDLGEAIRRCRIDFGTEIDLNLDPFIKNEGSVSDCFVVGKIKFSEEHLRRLAGGDRANGDSSRYVAKQTGIIVYFKPQVIGNVTADVRQYSIENEFFPQQPTTNQWFGEAQFESYRRLGQACAHSAFGQIRSERDLENAGRLSMRKIEALFNGLYARTHKA